jgi:hypothetical protein
VLADTVLRIAAVLEAKGWPARATGAAATERREAAAHYDVERARELWEAAKAKAKRNPNFEPLVQRATGVLDKARRRLDSALALRESLKHESDRRHSQDEAWRQLCEASRNCATKARGIFVPVQDDGSMAGADPIEREVPPAAFLNPGSAQDCRLHNQVDTPWGRYVQVNYENEEIDRIWPMQSPAPAADEREAFRTGFAGRPSGRWLVEAEMKRRAKSGELKLSLRAEAKALADWYALAYPTGPSIKAGAIRFSFAGLYRALVSAGGKKLSSSS